ncbi:MAG: hypothetical protein M3Y80_02000 [Verrucomicrobiota bacterium]|nr:hypothetical protein [Verrucomicrobiota bacterium]
MSSAKLLLIAGAALLSYSAIAQTSEPVVVVPANAPAATSTAPAAASPESATALKALEQVKAANAALLRQQAATLLQLEEMEKTAEQIKIYSRRS